MAISHSPTQRDAAPLGLDALDLHLHDVADPQDRAGRQLAAVQQAVLLDADIHKRAEVDHVAHGALQPQSRCEVVQREHVAAQDRRGQVLARVAAGPEQLLEDIVSVGTPVPSSAASCSSGCSGAQRVERRLALGGRRALGRCPRA